MKKILGQFVIIFIIAQSIQAQNTFPPSGNVGIGTLSPAYPIDIQLGFEVPVLLQLGTKQIYSGPGGIGFGKDVLSNITTAVDNISIGDSALANNITGRFNIAVGYESLKPNLSGENNVAIGDNTMSFNITGSDNVAVGKSALAGNKGGEQNVAVGFGALLNNRNSNSNTAVGSNSMYYNIQGAENTALGYGTLFENTKGNYNTAIGSISLYDNKLGSYNSALGYLVEVTSNNLSNSAGLGYWAIIDASNKMVFGNSSVSSIGGEVDWTVYSDARIKEQVEENVPGLDFINQLRPVTYHYNITTQNQLMGRMDTAMWTGKYDIEEMAFSGFIAQEVAAAAEDLGYEFSGVDDSGRLLGLRYATFVVPLVKAVQELDAENAALQKENEALKARLDRIEQLLNINEETGWKQEATITTTAMLGQNSPNPFTGNTVIPVYVPETATQAGLQITDLQGRLLQSFSLTTGYGNIELRAGQLTPGSYSYTLLVDGKVVDTRLMVIQ